VKQVQQKTVAPSDRKGLSGDEIFLVTLLAWLVPGAGHWMLHMRTKAVCYFAAVLGLFFAGAALGNFTIVNFRSYAFLLHACTGAASFAMSMITSRLSEMPNPTRWGDIGTTMTWIAGALNVLLIADVFDRANGGPFEADKPKPSYTRRILQRIMGRKNCSNT